MSSRVKVVIPLSGGKDSQACLKLAASQFELSEIRGLLCDTQWEHPLTYAHVEKLRDLYGPIRIDTVTAGSVPEQVLKHGRFPQGGSRFCTEELKIWPTKRYLKALAIKPATLTNAHSCAEIEMTPQEFVATLEPPEQLRHVAVVTCLPLYGVSQWLSAVRQHAGVKYDRWVFKINPMRLHGYIDGVEIPRLAITVYDELDRSKPFPTRDDGTLTVLREISL